MKKAIVVGIIIWLLLVATVSCSRAYDWSNPHQIMQDMLDSYTYMSYAQHVQPFDFHKWSWYEQQWAFSCEKLGKMTKKGSISDKMCKDVFLYYWWLEDSIGVRESQGIYWE